MVQHLWLNIKHQLQHRLSDRQQAKNLKKRMKDEGVLPMDRRTDICDCGVAFATEKWTQICFLFSNMVSQLQETEIFWMG